MINLILRPWQKLLIQISSSIMSLIIYGVRIAIITNPFKYSDPYLNVGWIIYIHLTIIWVVGITNAFNLIDGLDGLAAGVAFISCSYNFIIALLNNRTRSSSFNCYISGAILGFLPYNFNPASIFMGDTGAQLLGFFLAAISIEGAIKSATAFAIAVPILALGIPIYDTLFAMIRRKVKWKIYNASR